MIHIFYGHILKLKIGITKALAQLLVKYGCSGTMPVLFNIFRCWVLFNIYFNTFIYVNAVIFFIWPVPSSIILSYGLPLIGASIP